MPAVDLAGAGERGGGFGQQALLLPDAGERLEEECPGQGIRAVRESVEGGAEQEIGLLGLADQLPGGGLEDPGARADRADLLA
jgi:hypothetical protein